MTRFDDIRPALTADLFSLTQGAKDLVDDLTLNEFRALIAEMTADKDSDRGIWPNQV
jgi:hypothetical protein